MYIYIYTHSAWLKKKVIEVYIYFNNYKWLSIADYSNNIFTSQNSLNTSLYRKENNNFGDEDSIETMLKNV